MGPYFKAQKWKEEVAECGLGMPRILHQPGCSSMRFFLLHFHPSAAFYHSQVSACFPFPRTLAYTRLPSQVPPKTVLFIRSFVCIETKLAR